MGDHDWQQMFELFYEASERPAGDRAAYLDAACSDPSLRLRVEDLLASHDQAGGILDGSRTPIPSSSSCEAPISSPTSRSPATPASSPDRTENLLGTSIGPYRIDGLVGEGGMGVIYAATQTTPIRRSVALKVIKLGMDTRQVVARFESERQALAMMDHPNIATVHDGGATAGGRPYFAMELVDGEPITRYCDHHRLGVRARLQLFLPICRAVQHAHQKGVVHRDLKPHNLLVTSFDGHATPKVIDFGVAKALDKKLTEQTLVTGDGLMLGTPEYMSPEQAAARPDLDTRTDVYSLGIVLYELLVGALPFDAGGGLLDKLNNVLRHEPPRMSQRLLALGDPGAVAEQRSTTPGALQRALSGDLGHIVAKATEKDRAARYASASELAADLERYLADEPVTAGSPSTFYRLGKFVRRHRLEVAATTVIIGLLLAFGLHMTVQSSRLARALERVGRERDRASEVSSFLTELFTFADPAQTEGRVVPAREVLDRGAERIRHGLADPGLRADLMATLSEVYCHLGENEEAVSLARESLALRRALPTGPGAEVAESAYHLAIALREAGEYDEAEARARESADLRREAFGPRSLELAQSLRALGVILVRQGHAEAGEALIRQALDIEREKLPAEDPRLGTSLNDIAFALTSQGRLEEAADLHRQSLEHGRRYLDPEHVSIAMRTQNLGHTLKELGEFEAAEPLLRESVERQRRIYGDDHSAVADAEMNLAGLLSQTGRAAEAETLLLRAVETFRRRLGPAHPNLALGLLNLGSLARQQGEVERAIALYRQALPILADTVGAEHWRYGLLLQNLAVALQEAGDAEAAERHYKAALEVFRDTLGDEHQLIGKTLSSLGTLLRQQGDVEQAIAVYDEALSNIARTLGAEHWRYALLQQNIAVALRETGDLQGAEHKLREALAVYRKSLGQQHRLVGTALGSLGILQCQRSDVAGGLHTLSEALDVIDATLGPEHWRHDFLLAQQGRCHSLGGQKALAEPLYHEALAEMKEKLGTDHERVGRVEAWLAELD